MGDKQLPFDPIAEAGRQWESRWGPDPVAAMAAVTSIMRCEQILMAALNELLQPFALTYPRYEVLMIIHLSRNGSLPLGKISERLQVHRTSVTGLIDRLESQGLVLRSPHQSDRRKTLAEITAQGRNVAERATEVLNTANFAMRAMPDEGLERLVTLLRDIRIAAGDFPLRQRYSDDR